MKNFHQNLTIEIERLKTGIEKIKELRKRFWKELRIPGGANMINLELEKANRLADFLELGELMALDALQREESCGGHFREEFQTPEGEALRDDKGFSFVGTWEYQGPEKEHKLHKEVLDYEFTEVKTRNYK